MMKWLSEIMFVHIIRACMEQAKLKSGFLSALNDQRISKALKIMQNSPQVDWTLESLSTEVGMSRSVFLISLKD